MAFQEASAEQASEKLFVLSFRAKRGISLFSISIEERFLASLGMTKQKIFAANPAGTQSRTGSGQCGMPFSGVAARLKPCHTTHSTMTRANCR
jgi:hypothetical protein